MSGRILVVLGSPNSPEGKLGPIALSRLDCCMATFSEGDRIVCTGGWGAQFNTAPESHAYYAVNYLISKGIPESCFLDHAISGHTVEDAVKTKEIVSKYHNLELLVITSDFHLERTKFIFQTILKASNMSFLGVSSLFLGDALKLRIAHEKKALAQLREKGLYY